jgi:class 3 adenylate cyclase
MVVLRYKPPRERGRFFLIASEGTVQERRFPFCDRIEIRRLESGTAEEEGTLFVADPTVSAQHCLIVRTPDGRFFVRDTSRNGTRLDGRRLLPNRETELRPGQTITVGSAAPFRLLGCPGGEMAASLVARAGTMATPCSERISVVVGDIRGYTELLETSEREALQRAVSRVFARLEAVVHELGGEIKEYQGDSLLAFWEALTGDGPAVLACRAALALHHRVEALAGDPETWPFAQHPLHMDWAVATGSVSIQVFGEDRPEELSMVGEPIVLAYRIEKRADPATGPLLVCGKTRDEAGLRFEFEEIGPMDITGFNHPVPLFRLLREREEEDVVAAKGNRP